MNKAILEWNKYKDSFAPPKPEELLGEWEVEMDTWWGFLFKNKKVIKRIRSMTENGEGNLVPAKKIIGYNVAFWKYTWGRFNVREDGALYYHNRKIVDWLVRINKDKMKGLYLKNAKPKYTFTLRRIT